MTIIKAEDMHCEKCVERITKAMTDAGLDFQGLGVAPNRIGEVYGIFKAY